MFVTDFLEGRIVYETEKDFANELNKGIISYKKTRKTLELD